MTAAVAYCDEGPSCPKCGATFTADSPELFRETYEVTCDMCPTTYTVVTEISTMWISTEKMDD